MQKRHTERNSHRDKKDTLRPGRHETKETHNERLEMGQDERRTRTRVGIRPKGCTGKGGKGEARPARGAARSATFVF